MIIRPIKDGDAKEVLELHYTSVHKSAAPNYSTDILDEWSPKPDQDRVKTFLENPDNEIRVVALDDKRIVGFGCLVLSLNELRACYVLPEASRRGVGKDIVEYIENIARNNNLKFLNLDSSVTAKKFYEKCGYLVLKRKKHILSSGKEMDCFKMHKAL